MRLTIAALLLVSTQASAFDIKGIKLDSPMSDVEAMHPGLLTHCVSTDKPVSLCLYNPSIRQLPGRTAVPSLGTYAGQPLRYIAIRQREGKVASVTLSFEEKNYAAIKSAMDEKLGKPRERKTESFKTRVGVEYPNETSVWHDGEARLLLRQRISKVDQGAVMLTNEAELARDEADRAQKAKTNATDL